MQKSTYDFQQPDASVSAVGDEHCLSDISVQGRCALWCRAIPLTDRLTMLPLLYSILDYDRSPASFERYDKMSAWDLFQRSVTAHVDCHQGMSWHVRRGCENCMLLPAWFDRKRSHAACDAPVTHALTKVADSNLWSEWLLYQ